MPQGYEQWPAKHSPKKGDTVWVRVGDNYIIATYEYSIGTYWGTKHLVKYTNGDCEYVFLVSLYKNA